MNYYHDLKIPAETFFEIADTGDLQLLVIKYKHSNKVLSKAWIKIYDLYFEKRDDTKMKRVLDLRKRIKLGRYKSLVISNCLKALLIVNLPIKYIKKVCEKLKSIGIYIDYNEHITEEILSKIRVDVNNLNIQIDADIKKLENLTTEVKADYYDAIANLEEVFERPVPEQMSLAKFIALEKRKVEKIRAIKAENARNKRKR